MMDKEKQATALHWKIQQWKLRFQLMDEELLFIKRLLNSNAFKDNIPNLFERLQDFKTRLKYIDKRNTAVRAQISMYENDLGSELHVRTNSINTSDIKKSEGLQLEVDEFLGEYQDLKIEIFNYTGSILI